LLQKAKAPEGRTRAVASNEIDRYRSVCPIDTIECSDLPDLFSFLVRVLFAASIGWASMKATWSRRAGNPAQLLRPSADRLVAIWGAAHLAGSEAPSWSAFLHRPVRLLDMGHVSLDGLLVQRASGAMGRHRLQPFPVIGITSASMVLPDGPLFCALLLSAYVWQEVFSTGPGRPPAGGSCAALAQAWRYSRSIQPRFRSRRGLFLITAPAGRRWLAKRNPILRCRCAVAIPARNSMERRA